MGKLDELLKGGAANIAESMGAGVSKGAGGAVATSTAPARWQGVAKSKDALTIPVDKLTPDPEQPRKEFDPEAIAMLADSLKSRGQLQPIRVRWCSTAERWVIVSGERRWRAAQLAGLATVSAVEVQGTPTVDDLLEDQLVENCLREDLKPVEQARAFKALIDRRGWSYRQLGERLSIAPASITRALALLELPAPVQERVESGELAPSVAYEVSRVQNPDEQARLVDQVLAGGMTRDEAVAEVRRTAPTRTNGKTKGKVPRKLTERTFRAAGYKVTVENRRGIEAGSLVAALTEILAAVRAELQSGEVERDAA
jgi:ParB family chromosome partitioning protein